MLAKLERTLPVGAGLAYEPKWDGFRCLAFGNDLLSRNERPLTRYFPEVVTALAPLGDVVLDGELVICCDGRSDFPALLARLHPATSRVAQLAAETPASYVAFDLIAIGDEDLTTTDFVVRRERLEQLLSANPDGLVLTPQTRDPDEARDWLSAGDGSGIDGVVVKPDGLRYEPGRRVMVKVKEQRTVDCVVAGVRVHVDGGVGSLLLGLYDGPQLRHVGVVGSLAKV